MIIGLEETRVMAVDPNYSFYICVFQYFIYLLFILFVCLDGGSHVAKTGLELIM